MTGTSGPGTRVSVVIPAYNAGPLLVEAVESVLAQSHTDTEVVVVDDGSTDGSLAGIASLGARVRVQHIENAGACVARNVGWQHATGAYIKFLDADDYLLPDCLARQVAALQAMGPRSFPVGRTFRGLDTDTAPVPHARRDAQVPRAHESLVDLIYDVPLIAAPLYRRAQVEAIGGFVPGVAVRQDYDFFLRLLIADYTPVLTEERAFVYRQHASAGRTSRQRGEARYVAELAMFRRLVGEAGGIADLTRHAEVTEGLALSIWTSGRDALRAGARPVAAELFQLAQTCNPGRHVSGRSVYRWMNALVGPFVAEEIRGRFGTLPGSWT